MKERMKEKTIEEKAFWDGITFKLVKLGKVKYVYFRLG